MNANKKTGGTTRLILSAAACAVASGCNLAGHPYTEAPATPEPTIAETAPALAAAETAPTPATTFATPNVTRVTFAEEGADFDPCISRDGEKLVFASTQHRATSDIYIKRTNSRVVTQLTTDPADDAMPVLSPDGQRIAFASNRSGNWDIFVMPISGGKAVQITSDAADELHPSWSPDGAQLVFCRRGETSGRWELWSTEVANPASSNFLGYGIFPQWCPIAGTGEGGADRILFQLGRERGRRTFGIWTLDLHNGTATNSSEIASSADAALINPAWSPDGKWIAFAQVQTCDGDTTPAPHADFSGASSLWMVSVEGTGKVNLAAGADASLMPVWGANNKLYFVSNRGGAENIWSMDLGSALLAATGQPPAAPIATAPAPAAHEGH